MPTIQHDTLGAGEIHEPKGAATANAGEVYVADGAGSGAWTAYSDYAQLYTDDDDAATLSTIGTTVQTFPFVNAGPSQGSAASAANNNITVDLAGAYEVMFSCACSTVASGDSGTYHWHLAKNGTNTAFGTQRYLSGTNDTGSISFHCLINLVANDVLTITITSDNGADTDDINIVYAQFSAQLL